MHCSTQTTQYIAIQLNKLQKLEQKLRDRITLAWLHPILDERRENRLFCITLKGKHVYVAFYYTMLSTFILFIKKKTVFC